MPSKMNNPSSASHPPLGTFIDDEALELVEVLGVGGYGVVYRAEETCTPHPRSFAVKCLAHSHLRHNSRQRQIHLREIALHQLVSAHPNVVTLHRVLQDDDHTFIIMDYAPDHDLFTQILHGCRYLGNDYLIKHVFLQLLDVVEYCHSMSIYHRDLKPENVLCFDGGLRIALTDFGLATTDRFSHEYRTGSVYHMSPECQSGEYGHTGAYSPMANDIWSLGIILLNLATGRNPWKSASYSDPTFQAYVRDPMGFLPAVLPISMEVNAILVRMLDLDWRNRPSIAELKAAVEDVESFYSPTAVFEGSMARCSWEVSSDIERAPSSGEDSVLDADAEPSVAVVDKQSELVSKFSSAESASQMVFASRSGTVQTSYDSWAEEDAARTSTFGRQYSSEESESADDEEEVDELDEFSRDLFARARTPSSYSASHLSATDSNPPSCPMTPDYSSHQQQHRPIARQKPLTIDTNYLRPRYNPNASHSASSYVTATDEDSAGITAVDTDSFYYASREDMALDGGSIPMPEVFEMDMGVDSPSLWDFGSDYLPVSRHASIVMAEPDLEDDLDDTHPCSFPPSPTTHAYSARSTPASPSAARQVFAPSPTATRPRGMTMPSTVQYPLPSHPNLLPKPSPKSSLFRLFPSRGNSPAPRGSSPAPTSAESSSPNWLNRPSSPTPEQKRKSWFPRTRLFSSAGLA